MQKNTNISANTNSLLFVILLVFVLFVLKSLLVPLLFAIILSVSIFPLVQFFDHKLHFNSILSTLAALFIFIICICLLFAFIGYQISDIVEKSDTYAIKLEQVYNRNVSWLESNLNINTKDVFKSNSNFGKTIKDNFSGIVTFLGASGSLLGDMILVPIYMFFFLFYRKFFRDFLCKVFASGQENASLRYLFYKLYKVQRDYLSGLFTVMAIVGVLNSIGLLILGIENPFFYGFLAALLLLIPYIGILVGSLIPATIALATKDSSSYAVAVIGIFVFIQFIEGNFITPKITGSKVSINALVAIISIIAFSMLWGTSGMILALPIVASLKIIFDALPHLRPYGFLLGVPEDSHTNSAARLRLKKWKAHRKAANKKK